MAGFACHSQILDKDVFVSLVLLEDNVKLGLPRALRIPAVSLPTQTFLNFNVLTTPQEEQATHATAQPRAQDTVECTVKKRY